MNKKQSKLFFGEETQEKIRKMSEKEMYANLLDLYNTHYWTAILKYSQERAGFAQDGLNTTDPTKEPGLVARFQGILMGISDLTDLVRQLKEKADSISKGKVKDVEETPESEIGEE
jgi:NADPH:quinone reductase-like Zn-dependent oxidoreductase